MCDDGVGVSLEIPYQVGDLPVFSELAFVGESGDGAGGAEVGMPTAGEGDFGAIWKGIEASEVFCGAAVILAEFYDAVVPVDTPHTSLPFFEGLVGGRVMQKVDLHASRKYSERVVGQICELVAVT